MSQTKYVAPSLSETAFNCPHCGALTTQTWFRLRAEARAKDHKPVRLTPEMVAGVDFRQNEDPEAGRKREQWVSSMVAGSPFIMDDDSNYPPPWALHNADVSRCYNCSEVSFWLGSALVWPDRGEAPAPNPDLPADIRLDYEEAGRIYRVSPRGAAALLRLAIQKLCKALGEKGRKIDDDIASLVRKGLDVRIERALDIVRVVGNEAVHPGSLDMRDDVATAEKLFGLVNLVVDAMISQPKHIAEFYDTLPQSKRDAIAARERPALLSGPATEAADGSDEAAQGPDGSGNG